MLSIRVLIAFFILLGTPCFAAGAEKACCADHGGVCGKQCCDKTPLPADCKTEGPAFQENPAQVLTSSTSAPTALPDATAPRTENQKSIKDLIAAGAASVNGMACRAVEENMLELCSEERIRLIGVDTFEEFVARKLGNDAVRGEARVAAIGEMGKAATEFLNRLCEGKQIRVDFDTEKKDPDGRMAGYVYLPDETLVNAELIRQGYAFPATRPSQKAKYAELFQKSYEEAKEAHRGLWAGEQAGLLEEADATLSEFLGEWNDEAEESWSRKIQILQEDDKIYLVSLFSDGTSNRQELGREERDGKTIFRNFDSPTGDYFVITDKGNLGLYDNSGFIREAQKDGK